MYFFTQEHGCNAVKSRKAMNFERKTIRLYYQDFLLREAQTRVVRVEKDVIEFEATVAYPEGGGQESDHGVIRFEDGTTLRFDGAKKLYTHSAGLSEFPGLQVDGVIQHMIVEEDQPRLSRIERGMSAIVSIDVDRRARLALSHTASHLLYLGIGQFRPDAIKWTIGCHIKTDGARFDFSVETRFSADELLSIEQAANEYVHRNASVTVSAHQQVPDARLWHCEGHVIPCGGIHIAQAALIGPLQIRRRGLGVGKERISCVFPQAQIQLDGYHI
jgi:alanyl-tRNA synthetase